MATRSAEGEAGAAGREPPRPCALEQSGPNELEITWNDGHVSRYPVVHLRRSCRCASCIDEWTGKRLLAHDSIAEDVKPLNLKPVGNYAIHFEWSDGHSSGIYSFDHLRAICPCAECVGSTER